MNWKSFRQAAPEIARLAEERFERDELVLVGTLRRDGSPRISPTEPYVVHGELLLGMMWRSKKALDLLRDARAVVHTVVSDRQGRQGDVKLYGRAIPVEDERMRTRYADATEARLDWRPTAPFHLFRFDVATAGFAIFAPEPYALAWDPERGTRRLRLSE